MVPKNNTTNTSESLVIRAAEEGDLDRLMELSTLVGSGMTSMPTDRQSWVDKLERSIADFNREEPKKNGDIYFMVMEDLSTGKIVGSGAVYAGIGLHRPFYSYKLATITTSSEKLDLTIYTRMLNLVNDFTGTTEIGSLFLLPEYRRDGIGKFLSRSRFLLLADFPERFDEIVFAEMRGWLDENDDSPFWNALGKKFFDLSFQKADFISAVDGFQFISDLMPKSPVYLDLLPEEAQAVIGKPHDDAAGAFHILQKEGFSYSGYVDIFDAGPSIETPLDKIQTVKDSEDKVLKETFSIQESHAIKNFESYFLSNSQLRNYRMTRGPLMQLEDGGIAISDRDAAALKVQIGDTLKIVKE
jgi:arginine N-succinyltransferase